MTIDISELRKVIADCYWPTSPVAINEILDRLEAAEKGRDWHAERCEDAMNKCDALRAKITEMKKQEPVRHEFQGRDGDWYPFINQRHYENTVADGTWPIRALYALPGAQAQNVPKAVAYLDIGAGGYMDIGTDLTDEELDAIPKGRHMLGIVGTYGIEGYVPAQPAPSAPDGVAEALQRLIENGAVLGPASSEDALLVARYRQHLLACAPSVPVAALRPVIDWLRNGCDPQEAAKELEILIAAAPEAKP